jgi:hypothetical protein
MASQTWQSMNSTVRDLPAWATVEYSRACHSGALPELNVTRGVTPPHHHIQRMATIIQSAKRGKQIMKVIINTVSTI